MHRYLSAFLALGAWQALSVAAQGDPACLANCGSQVRADFTKFACANADDAPCLCANSDFKFGVRDCSKACGGSDADSDTFLNDNFCIGQAPPAAEPSSEAAPEAPTTAPAEPATTAAEEATTEAAPTTAPEPTTATPEETPVPETTSESIVEETTSESTSETEAAAPTPAAEESTTAAAETQPSTTLATKSRVSSASDASETAGAGTAKDEDATEEKDDEGGLSQTAIIGIAVGAGAGGLALIGLLVWLCLRKRTKKETRPFMEISKPMPADGTGMYTGRRDPFAEKRGEVIEMTSNRYEDMLPRQEPRTVV